MTCKSLADDRSNHLSRRTITLIFYVQREVITCSAICDAVRVASTGTGTSSCASFKQLYFVLRTLPSYDTVTVYYPHQDSYEVIIMSTNYTEVPSTSTVLLTPTPCRLGMPPNYSRKHPIQEQPYEVLTSTHPSWKSRPPSGALPTPPGWRAGSGGSGGRWSNQLNNFWCGCSTRL